MARGGPAGRTTDLRSNAGEWFLEDANSSVPLDLEDVTVAEGLFTERCAVLAQGELVDDRFKVAARTV